MLNVESQEISLRVAGAGVVASFGRGIPALACAIRANRSCLGPCPRLAGCETAKLPLGTVPEDAWAAMRAEFPEFARNDALLLAAAAMEDAGAAATATLSAIGPGRVGLVLSTTKAGIDKLEDYAAGKPVSPADIGAASGSGIACALAARAGISGPAQCVSLACASGLAAVERAANLLLGDRADAVFVVGADILSKFVVSGFNALKSIDPDGCRPFDAHRRGLSPGEAGAALLLVRDGPRAPGPAIAGWGTSNDANHLTGPSRDGKGLALAIERALAGAGVAPAGIGYIHGHGTGTVYNDSMESLALKTVFGGAIPPVSSTKRITGHTMGAAGLVETVICLAAAETRLLPGTAGLENPAADAPGSILGAPAERERAPTHILKLNSGFGGVNAALVIRTGAGQ